MYCKVDGISEVLLVVVVVVVDVVVVVVVVVGVDDLVEKRFAG